MAETNSSSLTEDDIATYRRQARKTLVGSGYNLFAEITLRLIDHHYAQLAETMNVRSEGADRALEADFLAQENAELKGKLQALELERKRLQAQVDHLQRELERLQRKKLNLPPSWM